MKRKMVSEMLRAKVDVEKISKSLNCSPVLVEKVKSLEPQTAKSNTNQTFAKPSKPLNQDEMAKMVLQMIKARKKAEEICRTVGCERQFVFQVRNQYSTVDYYKYLLRKYTIDHISYGVTSNLKYNVFR